MRSGRSVAPSLVGLGGRIAPLFLPLLARPAFSRCALAGRAPLSRPAPRLCFGFCAPLSSSVPAMRWPSAVARLWRVSGAQAYGLQRCLRAPIRLQPTDTKEAYGLPSGSSLRTPKMPTGSRPAPAYGHQTRRGAPLPPSHSPLRLPLLTSSASCSSGGGARPLGCASLYPSSLGRFASRRRGCAPSPRTPSPRGYRIDRGRRARSLLTGGFCRAHGARGGWGTAGGTLPPACVRLASAASRKRAAPPPPPTARCYALPRARWARAPPSSGRRTQPVACGITAASL